MKFRELGICPEINKAIQNMGFTEPTPIQKRSIPEIFSGHDIVGQSLTGSGKTLAFAVPMIQNLKHNSGIEALILAPTRELVLQIKDKIEELSHFMKAKICVVYGGVGINPQIDCLRKAEIVISTPGRLLDHIGRGTIDLKNVKTLVLDEADKMFEMGFIDDVKKIISFLPKSRQTLLFSATMPEEVTRIIRNYQKNPKIIKEKMHVEGNFLKQVYYDVASRDKFSILVHLLKNKTPGLAIVFCATRREVDILTKNLKQQKLHVMAVHGGLSQNNRTHAVYSLKKEDIQILVATDVAARGLDINNVTNIYNYDSAKTSEEYTHRIGRTARAGKSGVAATLLSDKDHSNFTNVLRDSNIQIEKEELPNFERVHFIRHSPERRRFDKGNARQKPNAGRFRHSNQSKHSSRTTKNRRSRHNTSNTSKGNYHKRREYSHHSKRR